MAYRDAYIYSAMHTRAHSVRLSANKEINYKQNA